MSENQSSVGTEQIWRELSDRLRQFIRSRVSSSADADDILQTVFLSIHQKLDTVRSTERLEPWVFQIARNAIVDYFRRAHVSDNRVEEIAIEPAETHDANAEVSRCLGTLINHLPADQKRAVSLYELDGVSQAEIAEQESISLSAAKSRIQRGRKKLESMLRECCRFQLDARGNVLEYQRQGNSCKSDYNCGDSCE